MTMQDARAALRRIVAIGCAALLLSAALPAQAQYPYPSPTQYPYPSQPYPYPDQSPYPQPYPAPTAPYPPAAGPEAPLLAPHQLDDLVAPIALYPDPLVAQILAAATYPLEVVQASRWVRANPGLVDTALTDAARSQPWDPSVQALVVFPSVLETMDRNLTWTTDLGNAFLAQEADVMDAIQRQRHRAMAAGLLASNAQQVVEQVPAEYGPVIVIHPARPDVIYVPVYDPVVVWGPPVYRPWPSFWYPPRPAGAFVAAGLGGFLVAIPVARHFRHWGGWGGWGWDPGWRHRNVVVNRNFYVRNDYRAPRDHREPGGAFTSDTHRWSHDPRHRRSLAYPSRRVAERVAAPAVEAPRPSGQPRARETPPSPSRRFEGAIPRSAPPPAVVPDLPPAQTRAPREQRDPRADRPAPPAPGPAQTPPRERRDPRAERPAPPPPQARREHQDSRAESHMPTVAPPRVRPTQPPLPEERSRPSRAPEPAVRATTPREISPMERPASRAIERDRPRHPQPPAARAMPPAGPPGPPPGRPSAPPAVRQAPPARPEPPRPQAIAPRPREAPQPSASPREHPRPQNDRRGGPGRDK